MFWNLRNNEKTIRWFDVRKRQEKIYEKNNHKQIEKKKSANDTVNRIHFKQFKCRKSKGSILAFLWKSMKNRLQYHKYWNTSLQFCLSIFYKFRNSLSILHFNFLFPSKIICMNMMCWHSTICKKEVRNKLSNYIVFLLLIIASQFCKRQFSRNSRNEIVFYRIS